MDKYLESELQKLEEELKELEALSKSVRERFTKIKEILWDRESKKESSKMSKVLDGDKDSTIINSNIGKILVDKDFMEKEKTKHLDNPNLRGMISKEELLSFPKVAKNVEAEYNEKHKNYTWKVEAEDENIVTYGSREYKIDGKETNRLLTAHSKTEANKRKVEVDRRGLPYHSIFNDFNFRTSTKTGRGERGQPHRQINDLDFHNPASESIAQNKTSALEYFRANPKNEAKAQDNKPLEDSKHNQTRRYRK